MSNKIIKIKTRVLNKTPREAIEKMASELGISFEELLEFKNEFKVFTSKLDLKNKRNLDGCRRGGRVASTKNWKNGVGLAGMDPKLRSEISSQNAIKANKTNKANGTAIYGLTFEQRSLNGKKGNETNKKNGTALYGMSPEKRTEISKKRVTAALNSGNHNSFKLKDAAKKSYENILILMPETFTNKDIKTILVENNIASHNFPQYRNYWLKINKIKRVYKPKGASNASDIEIYQKLNKNGECSATKLKEYRDSLQLLSTQAINSNKVMALIIEDLPETFTIKQVAPILIKHGKGPMYIKDVIAKYSYRFELIGTVAAKKPEGRGGNKAQNLYKKMINSNFLIK